MATLLSDVKQKQKQDFLSKQNQRQYYMNRSLSNVET